MHGSRMFHIPPQGPPNPYPARDGEKGQVGDPGRMGQDGAPGMVGPRGDYGDTPEELKVFTMLPTGRNFGPLAQKRLFCRKCGIVTQGLFFVCFRAH
jgi:hypothetical protein